MPSQAVRDTLGDFVNQYAGFAQTTTTLGLASGVPRQVLANPFPAGVNPVIEPYGQAYGRYTNLGGAISLDQYELRPQINDRFNLSLQRKLWFGIVGDLSYFFNYGTRVPYDKQPEHDGPGVQVRAEDGHQRAGRQPVPQLPDGGQVPGVAAQRVDRLASRSLLVPYPQYGTITQTNTNGRKMRTHTVEVRLQRPFTNGLSFLVSYAYNNEKRQEWFDDLASVQGDQE